MNNNNEILLQGENYLWKPTAMYVSKPLYVQTLWKAFILNYNIEKQFISCHIKEVIAFFWIKRCTKTLWTPFCRNLEVSMRRCIWIFKNFSNNFIKIIELDKFRGLLCKSWGYWDPHAIHLFLGHITQ